jgi:ribosomal protein S18 acetylase RimI-like enzyme
MDIEIRPYQDSDEDEWMRAYAVIMAQSHAWNDCIQIRPDYAGRDSDCLVAIVDGKIAGITDIQYDNEKGDVCFNRDTKGGYVPILGRLPEYPGMSIGPRLIDAAMDAAQARGFTRLEYWSQDRNAQRFYRKLDLPELGRHYRFRFKVTDAINETLKDHPMGVEYIYAICTPEVWPAIKQKYDILTDHPHEPLLCIGFEINNFQKRFTP